MTTRREHEEHQDADAKADQGLDKKDEQGRVDPAEIEGGKVEQGNPPHAQGEESKPKQQEEYKIVEPEQKYENQEVKAEPVKVTDEKGKEKEERNTYVFKDDEELGPRLVATDKNMPLHGGGKTSESDEKYQRVPQLPAKVKQVLVIGEQPYTTVKLLLENGGTHTVAVA